MKPDRTLFSGVRSACHAGCAIVPLLIPFVSVPSVRAQDSANNEVEFDPAFDPFRRAAALLESSEDPIPTTSHSGDTERTLAAKYLIENPSPEALAVLTRILVSAGNLPSRLAVVRVLAHTAEPPQALLGSLLDSLSASEPEFFDAGLPALTQFGSAAATAVIDRLRVPDDEPRTRRLLSMLGRLPTVASVDALIPFLDERNSALVRAAALESLTRITGQSRCGDSMLCWQAWWRQNRPRGDVGLMEGRLLALEVHCLALEQAVSMAAADRSDLLNDLLDALEREYILTPPTDRSRLVARLLRDHRREIAARGLEYVTRVMTNAQPLDPSVRDALAELCLDSAADLRQQALARLSFLDAARAQQIVLERLSVESSPEVRREMYRVLAANPSVKCVEILLSLWLNRPNERAGSAPALLAALNAGLLTQAQQSALTAALLRTADAADPRDLEILSRCELAADDVSAPGRRELLRNALLGTLGPDRLIAVARGLSASDHDRDLLSQAAANPLVYPFAVAAATRRPSIDSVRTLLNMSAPGTDQRTQALLDAIELLPDNDVCAADDLLRNSQALDLTQRLALLTRRIDLLLGTNAGPDVEVSPGSEPAGSGLILTDLHRVEVVTPIVLRLASVQLSEAGDCTAALAALGRLPVGLSDDALREVERLASIARLVAGGASPRPDLLTWDDWSLALRLALHPRAGLAPDPDAGRNLIESMRGVFGPELTPEQTALLNAAQEEISVLTGAGDDPGD